MNQEKVAEFVSDYLLANLKSDHVYHNLDRTREIVSKTEELIKETDLKKTNAEHALIAAWFMNVGFASDYNDHVNSSCSLAKSYLSDQDEETKTIEDVCAYIKAAWHPDEPDNESVKILKDARTAHYASKNFSELIELQRMELVNCTETAPTVAEWRKEHIELLQNQHRFYTDYAVKNWKDEKEANVIGLVKDATKSKKKRKKEKLKVNLKNQSPERAIQSLFRIQLRNHIKLSDIADTKANILLSVNAIVISLLMANLIPTLDNPDNSYLIYPTMIFVLFSIVSMILAVLATRPKINNEKMIAKELDDRDTNYLFFGNFYALELNDFKNKIGGIIKSKKAIYDSLTMDLYFLGKVLQNKYKMLRWTYTIFIIGIVLSVIAFAFALKYFGMEKEIIDAVTPDVK